MNRLAELAPPEALEAWDQLILCHTHRDASAMRAFSRWLPRRYCEALCVHFAHPDIEWAGCAYQAYLNRSVRPILLHRWRQRDRTPLIEARQLDRFLFAPAPVRPNRIVEDIQMVENDPRLVDPFNCRGY